MRPILEIYSAYQIMPNLQEHQLRVAAVAKVICDSFKETIDSRPVIEACLLHDMGNILKIDLTRPLFPEHIKAQGLKYWENVQANFKGKYGPDEHTATQKIAVEIGVLKATTDCLKAVGFSKAVENAASPLIAYKICCYADMRVGPFGVLPLAERIAEAQKRYTEKRAFCDQSTYASILSAHVALETQIFAQSRLIPGQINDALIAPIVEELRQFKVS